MYIAQVPMDQKQEMLNAQNDYSRAKAEHAKAEADFQESASFLTVVKNDAKTAHNQLDSAMTMKKTAEKSGDMNRANAATKDERVAEDLAKAADHRVKYFERYRDFLKTQERYTLETMYWREAQFELSKSSIAQKTGKAIANQNYAWYPSQESERAKRAAKWKDKLEGARKTALSQRDEWLKAQKTADTEAGHPVQYSTPDPMNAPAPDAAAN